MSNKQTAAMLDKKLDDKTVHTMLVGGIVMCCAAPRRRPYPSGAELERAYKVDTVVFDKTGTLTGPCVLLLLGSAGHSALELPTGAGFGAVLLVGLLQSPHCIGMCGGILLGQSAPNALPIWPITLGASRPTRPSTLSSAPLMLLFGGIGALFPRKWNKYLLKASAVLVTTMGLKMLVMGLRML